MARSICSGLTGLMPTSEMHPAGKRSRAATCSTLMRPSWRMLRQPGMTAPTWAALRCILCSGSADSSVPASGAQKQGIIARIQAAAAASLVEIRVNSPPARLTMPTSHANCCWFLSLVPWAALFAKKPRSTCVGRLTSTLGCGSAKPEVTARRAPASRRRYATAWSTLALTRAKLSRTVTRCSRLPAALSSSTSAAGPASRVPQASGLVMSSTRHCTNAPKAGRTARLSGVGVLASPARPDTKVRQLAAQATASSASATPG